MCFFAWDISILSIHVDYRISNDSSSQIFKFSLSLSMKATNHTRGFNLYLLYYFSFRNPHSDLYWLEDLAIYPRRDIKPSSYVFFYFSRLGMGIRLALPFKLSLVSSLEGRGYLEGKGSHLLTLNKWSPYFSSFLESLMYS